MEGGLLEKGVRRGGGGGELDCNDKVGSGAQKGRFERGEGGREGGQQYNYIAGAMRKQKRYKGGL